MSKKRDQRAYDLFQKYRFTFVLHILIIIVNKLDEPYTLKPSVSGVHGYPPRAMAIVIFMMEELHLTYRGAVGYLNGHCEKLKAIGLDKIPSKSTIHRNSAKIPDGYYRQMHFKVIMGIVTGNIAGDSSGFSVRKFIPWFSVKKDAKMWKKGWRKLHILIDIRTRVILEYRITHAYRADSPVMEEILTSMVETISGKIGDACFDSAYLTRKICNLISKMGGTPFIKPKSNTISNSRGSYSWKEMVIMYLKNLAKFNDHYHQRNIVEAVFAALKERRGRGGSLRSRMSRTQDKELAIQVISYNIDMVARAEIKSGNLTEDMLKAMTVI